MAITYVNNEQIIIEIKKLMLENKISQREIANKMQIKPQGLTKILGKKNFGFEDAEKILNAMGFDLIIDFKPFTSPAELTHRKQELLSELDGLQNKPKPQSMPKQEPIKETLDEKIERIQSELDSKHRNYSTSEQSPQK